MASLIETLTRDLQRKEQLKKVLQAQHDVPTTDQLKSRILSVSNDIAELRQLIRVAKEPDLAGR